MFPSNVAVAVVKISLTFTSVVFADVVYQPAKSYPVFVAVGSSVAVYAVSYVFVTDSIASPPSTLYANVYVFAFQIAYNVTVAPSVSVSDLLTVSLSANFFSPFSSSDQPWNVYPVFAYVFAVSAFAV